MKKLSILEIEEKALHMRREIIRMIHKAKSGHPGSSLSAADILAVLFFHEMKHDPSYPEWPDRDRFIFSKGHGVPALYAALALNGYFPIRELLTLRQINSRLQGHPDRRALPGVEASTGSLGQGLSIGIGHALAHRLLTKKFRTYVMLGDGECNEGQVWEAAMFASFHKLDSLCAILDYNKFQLDNSVKVVLDMHPMEEKWRAFGWAVREINGHNIGEILGAFEWARAVNNQPQMIIAHTIKGKGVSFMEHNNHFHGVAPNDAEMKTALAELGEPVNI
ncbi:MAG: transketolase [Candidatus Omnitrophica bacterium]|nr:transketolase [Candidatus Omnitrophota bacterium]